ncbi:MAG TPA: hypothetical protein VFJ04_07290 [Rhodanobacteraceae bacterium]|nr:hypothetical protein [Rhodanobacteraceae bacterium]
MKSHRPVLTLLCASLLAAFAMPALADGTPSAQDSSQTSAQLTTHYTQFAGSEANAQALVTGLQDGTPITLEDAVTNADGTVTTTPVTFQPTTGKLGTGEVNVALALASDELTKSGIADPTAAQIEAALNGGSITLADGSAADLSGVLAMRAAGQGWGQIANTLGFKLGDVVSASKSANAQAGADHANGGQAQAQVGAEQHAQVGTDHSNTNASTHAAIGVTAGERPQGMQRPTRPERPERPQRPELPTHNGRPGG